MEIKELILHRLTLRVAYIICALSTSKLVSLTASQEFIDFSKAGGFVFNVVDKAKFQMWIMGVMMVGGEFVYHWAHKALMPEIRTLDSTKEKAAAVQEAEYKKEEVK